MCVCESVFAVEGVVVKKSCQRVLAFTECVIIFILTFLFIFLHSDYDVTVKHVFRQRIT